MPLFLYSSSLPSAAGIFIKNRFMKEAFAKTENGNLFYRENGKGPAVVLLHGFGEDSTVWKDQYEAFPGFQLLLPDLPGSGGSPMIPDMSMEGMAAVIQQWLDSLNIEQCILVGHSMGGYIALAFAETYSSRL